MKFTQLFANFVNSGKRPTSDRETSALLDEARSVISSITERIASGEIKMAGPVSKMLVPTNSTNPIFGRKPSAPTPAPAASKPIAAAKPAAAPVATAKPAPVSTKDQLVTAYKKARLSGQSTSAIVAQINKL
jgi:hypothetical protein